MLLGRAPVRRLPVTWRPRAAVLLASVALMGSAGLTYIVAAPRTISIQATSVGFVISHVTIGSAWWARGLRPGMVAEPWPADATPGVGFTAVVGGAAIDVNLDARRREGSHLVVAALAMIGAWILVRLGLPGRATLLVLAATVAAAPWYPELGLPLAMPLACLPLLVAWLGVEPKTPLSRQRLTAASTLTIAVVIGGGSLLMIGSPISWSLVWLAPSLAAFLLLASGAALCARDELREIAPLGRIGRIGVIRQLLPLARESRLDGLESERRRVAEEVHDEVLPRLAASLRTLDAGSLDASVTAAQLHEVAESLRNLMNGRQLVVLEVGGLAAALESHIQLLRRDGAPIDLTTSGDATRPPIAVELSAYRIAQAAIENSLAHARASSIEVRLHSTGGAVELAVRDDGIGASAGRALEALHDGHVGVGEMYQRAAQLEARLTITPRTPSGTEVYFRWPD